MSAFIRILLIIVLLGIAACVVPLMIGNHWGTPQFGETAISVLMLGAGAVVGLGMFLDMCFNINILED